MTLLSRYSMGPIFFLCSLKIYEYAVSPGTLELKSYKGVPLFFSMDTLQKKLMVAIIVVVSISACAQQRSRRTQSADTVGTLTRDGLERTYLLHVPATYEEGEPTPLVIALHGGGGTSGNMANFTNFNSLSDREGFIVVYPQGIEGHWNDGRKIEAYRAHRENVDDVGFISTLIDHLREEFTVDETRVYATGISNGAMMSHRLACELSDKIAAIAMVAGAIPEDFAPYCSPSHAVSVLVMDGTQDRLIPWEGGVVAGGARDLGSTLSVADTVAYWVEHNGCRASPVVTWLPDTAPDDGTRVREEAYNGGREGTEVILYAVEGGGHTWPGGIQYEAEAVIGRVCRDIDGSEVIWQFFKAHQR